MAKKKKKRAAPKPPTIQRPKEFLDLIAPGAIQFNTDNFVFGNGGASASALPKP